MLSNYVLLIRRCRALYGSVIPVFLAAVFPIPIDSAPVDGLKPSTISMPAYFEPLEGGLNPEILFIARHQSGVLGVSSRGLDIRTRSGAHIKVHWLHGKPGQLRGVDPLPGKSNYFAGSDPAAWRTGVLHYSGVEVASIYPGVDATVYVGEDGLEYDFEVALGASINRIGLHIDGARRLSVNRRGDLEMHTADGTITQRRPRAFQTVGGKRVELAARYVIRNGTTVNFAVTGHDSSLPLTIDPVLSFSTYLGGSAEDAIKAVAVDNAGHVYLTGSTRSTDFPLQSPVQGSKKGVAPPNPNATFDVFVAKIHIATRSLVYSTYLGSVGNDLPGALAVDAVGNAYITGSAGAADYPLLNPIRSANESGEAFVTKLSPTGALVYSTFLGGLGGDSGNAIYVDSSQRAYIAGMTGSPDFPAFNAYQAPNDHFQVFLTRLNAAGSAMDFSSVWGGSLSDTANHIAVDVEGNIILTGTTSSLDYPVLSPVQTAAAPMQSSAFVTKLAPSAAALVYSTYLGPSASTPQFNGSTRGYGITVDGAGNTYVVGATNSYMFPLVNSLHAKPVGTDCFVTRLSPSGALSFSTLFGSGGSEECHAVSLDSSGRIWVAGSGNPTGDLPLLEPIQSARSSYSSNLLFQLTNDATSILFATLLNTTQGQINAGGMTVDSAGNVYLAGEVWAAGFPTVNPIQQHSNSIDGFLSVISGQAQCSYAVSLASSAIPAQGGSGAVNVTTQPGCWWNAVSRGELVIDGPNSGPNNVCCGTWYEKTGSGQATFSVGYAGGPDRAFDIVVAGKPVTVFQQGYGCAPQLSSANNTMPAAGGNASFAISDRDQCTYQAVSNAPWIVLQPPTSGVSGGNVSYTVSSNSTCSERQGTISVAGLTYSVTQPALACGATAPQTISVSPSAGAGSGGVFTFTYSDANGHADMLAARVLIQQQVNGVNACYVYYTKSDNKLYLHNDAGTQLSAPLTPGVDMTIQNSQCVLNGSISTATMSGDTLTLTLFISFKPAFAGNKNVFGYVEDRGGLASGWKALGTFTVPEPPPNTVAPQFVSVSPASGAGAKQAFSFTFSDGDGHMNIHTARFLINQQANGANACYLHYTKADNKLYLYNDAGTTLSAPISIAGSGGAENSQCSITGAETSMWTTSQNATLLNITITFKSQFAGLKNVYGYIEDNGGLASGWQPGGTWTVPVNAAPQPISVSPSSGNTASQTFAFLYQDLNGHAEIHSARVLIHHAIQGVASCYLYYTKADNKLYLHTDTGAQLTAPLTPGISGTIQNSQCSVDGSASSASAGGNTLTLVLAITFSPAFQGPKNIFGYAEDFGGLASGWQAIGTWLAPGGVSTPTAPEVVSVVPASGAGSAASFYFTYSDANGHANIHSARVLIHQQLFGANACYVYYTKTDNRLWLHNDAANQLIGPITPGASGTLENSQCIVDASSSHAAATEDSLSLRLAIAFKFNFAGSKTVFGYVEDSGGLSSGWHTLGSWVVPAGGPPAAPRPEGASPSAGSGASQTFTVTFSDATGHHDIHSVRVLFNEYVQGANACYIYYTKADNKLYLHNDAANQLLPPLTPGTPGTVQNSQCSIDGAGSSASATGTTLALTISISFAPEFFGTKTLLGLAQDVGGLASNWQSLGVWKVTGNSPPPTPPEPISMVPTAGVASSQLFTFTFVDDNGHADIHSGRILFHEVLQGGSSCYLYYTKSDNKLYLHNDSGSQLTAPLTPGAPGKIENSQCSVDGAASSVSGSGNTLTLSLSISFQPGFTGNKNVFGLAQDLGGLLSGWRVIGSWMIPGGSIGPTTPQTVSANPSSGTGSTQLFTFSYSDANGHADIRAARVLIHPQVQGANSCYLYYTKVDNKLYLHNDPADQLTHPITPGSPGTIQNSQCSVNGSASSVSASGDTLTLTLSITFTPGFSGANTVFGFVEDSVSFVSGWRALGTWNVP
jgi:hypothetical protein